MIWLYRSGGAKTPPEDLSQEVLSGFYVPRGSIEDLGRDQERGGKRGWSCEGGSVLLRVVVVVLRYKD